MDEKGIYHKTIEPEAAARDKKGIVLRPEFERAVLDLGFSEFTEIQERCIPLIQRGRDVIGSAYTGSGKTAAFGFPALEKVTPGCGIQLLVITPTRELCVQVALEFRKFTRYRRTFIVEVYGGVAINPQIDGLRSADVVVGTPGRLLDHLSRGTLRLDNLKVLVIDEADKLFEMGFIDDIKRILSRVPRNSQKLLFSATMSPDILHIAKNYMNNPESVKMQAYLDEDKIIQHYYDIERDDKFSLLVHILKTNPKGLILIFCGTRHNVDRISKNLNKQKIEAEALHGGITQNRRNQVMGAFRDGKLDVLVASDVAARGLDIKHLDLVINYDIPRTSREYVHRIGRTARAGKEGKVISLLCPEDYDKFRAVLGDKSLLIDRMDAPQFEHVEIARPLRFTPSDKNRGRPPHQRYGRQTNRRHGGQSPQRYGRQENQRQGRPSNQRDDRSGQGRPQERGGRYAPRPRTGSSPYRGNEYSRN